MILKDYIKINPKFQVLQTTKICIDCKKRKSIFLFDYRNDTKKLITQTKLAKSIGVTFQQIQKYEKGYNGLSAIKLLKICNFFNKPIEFFVADAISNFPALNKIYLGKKELFSKVEPLNNNSDVILAPSNLTELN